METWEFLLRQTVLYAAGHVRRWRWRGSLSGVPPGGYDPNSLASEAISEFLQQSDRQSELLHLPITVIQRDLERRVRRLINRLHHRSENRLIRNEPDLAPVVLDDREVVRIIDLTPDPNPRPDKVAIVNESRAALDELKLGFTASLRKDRHLLRLFQLYCDDRSKPDDLASNLKLGRGAVRNLRRRFRRRWAEFHDGSIPTNCNSDEYSHSARSPSKVRS